MIAMKDGAVFGSLRYAAAWPVVRWGLLVDAQGVYRREKSQFFGG
jgi:hypothetical protein